MPRYKSLYPGDDIEDAMTDRTSPETETLLSQCPIGVSNPKYCSAGSCQRCSDFRDGFNAAKSDLAPRPDLWRPIDTAPQNGERVTLYQKGRGTFEGWWHVSWPHPEAYWMDDADSEPAPTHWMPLLQGPDTSTDRTSK